MKEFNLEAAKAGKPVCTRDGRKARIICFDKKGGEHSIVALVLHGDGIERVETYLLDGRFTDNGEHSELDLMMLPEKHEGWVNIIKIDNGDPMMCPHVFQSKDEAIKDIANDVRRKYYIATVKIEWED